jgi:3',5'-cyclic AMP phosphodiesterase CpdA
MSNLHFRFGIISDLHIATPQTIDNIPNRFHLVEVSIPALQKALTHLESLNLDFLLLPGDLTQNGEPENHRWLVDQLSQLPFPAYVIPGNHDIPTLDATEKNIGTKDFSSYYQQFGYQDTQELYYGREILPGVQLIGLNSNNFARDSNQQNYLDAEQLTWLKTTLDNLSDRLVLVTIHHNVIEHLPGQSQHLLGRRYMLDNALELLEILERYQVKFIFTGHLHVQDIASFNNIYEICTGSLVSFPHPYRIIEINSDRNRIELKVESYKINSVAGYENLADISREWLGDRANYFMVKLLTSPPLNLSETEALKYAPHLRYFWADIAQGDRVFNFPDFPVKVRKYLESFGAIDASGKHASIDNQTIIKC